LDTQRNTPFVASVDLAGSLPVFPVAPGDTLATSYGLPDFRQKRLLFGAFTRPGQVHVYSAKCRAGERLRVQMLAPILANGKAVTPAFAVIAQSLPYSADVRRLPLELPAGYSAVVAAPPAAFVTPVRDVLTRVNYYPGPLVDTRTLVGGRCYIVVWNPQNQMGKYVLQLGGGWPMRGGYWLGLPRYWWQIRGWFGLSRTAAYLVAGGLLIGALVLGALLRRRLGRVGEIKEIGEIERD
jgi:hypothetical protein